MEVLRIGLVRGAGQSASGMHRHPRRCPACVRSAGQGDIPGRTEVVLRRIGPAGCSHAAEEGMGLLGRLDSSPVAADAVGRPGDTAGKADRLSRSRSVQSLAGHHSLAAVVGSFRKSSRQSCSFHMVAVHHTVHHTVLGRIDPVAGSRTGPLVGSWSW